MNKPLIIDCSSNQDHPIDWAKVKMAGVDGVILKATQGTNYINPYFLEDLRGCTENKIPVMAYHFAGFGNVSEEVMEFERVAGTRARVLDIETSTNVRWANAFLEELRNKYHFNTGQTMLYGSASSIPRIHTSLLWVAAYNNVGPGVPNTALWQYSQTGHIDGIANNVDLSHWMGTQDQFDMFFGVHLPPSTKNPTPEELEKAGLVLLPNPAAAHEAISNGWTIYVWDGRSFVGASASEAHGTPEYASKKYKSKR